MKGGEKVELTDIKIGDVDGYNLHFFNNKFGDLSLSFNGFNRTGKDWEYRINIDEKGISFERVVDKPHTDHYDMEYLCVAVGERLVGTLKWRKEHPDASESWDCFYVPFGAKRVDY